MLQYGWQVEGITEAVGFFDGSSFTAWRMGGGEEKISSPFFLRIPSWDGTAAVVPWQEPLIPSVQNVRRRPHSRGSETHTLVSINTIFPHDDFLL